MEGRTAEQESADLRYLEADHVRCPAGTLSEFRVSTEDAKPLGIVEGVLISRSLGRLAYLVLRLPGLLMSRRFLLPIEAGAVVEDAPKVLRVHARREDLHLRTFTPRSVPNLSGADLNAALFAADAR